MNTLISTAGKLMLMPFLVLEHFDTVERIEKLLAREGDGGFQNGFPHLGNHIIPYPVPRQEASLPVGSRAGIREA